MTAPRPLVGFLVALMLISNVSGQTPNVDPQLLVGQWSGDVQGPVNVQYYLTITKAEGNRLMGKARAVGPRGASEYDISGTVEGNVFKYQSADKDLSVELVVDGDTMKGFGERKRASATGKFSLTRAK